MLGIFVGKQYILEMLHSGLSQNLLTDFHDDGEVHSITSFKCHATYYALT